MINPGTLKHRLFAIGGATALRSVFMLALSVAVYRVGSPDEAARFFQLIFFQAILIAFLSASGFFRVQSLGSDDHTADYLAAMMLLVVPSALLVIAFPLLFAAYAGNNIELTIVWVGSVATSFSAPLAGYVLGRFGAYRAFAPSALAAAIGAALVAWFSPWSNLTPYLILGFFQVATFVFLFAQVPHLATRAFSRLWENGIVAIASRIGEGAVVGFVNVANLGFIFAFRHQWDLRAESEAVATVFFLMRISDAGLQMVHMALSGHPIVDRLFRHPARVVALCLTAGVSAIGLLLLSQVASYGLVFFIVAQLVIDLLRYPWSLGFVFQMKHFDLTRYVIFALLPPVFGMLCSVYLILVGHPLALHALVGGMIAMGALISAKPSERQKSSVNSP